MKHRYFDPWRKIAFVLWGVCCLVPGLLVALSRSSGVGLRVEKLSELYGHDVGAYLGYCPSALLAYLLPLLVLSPVIFLLTALGGERPAANATRDALRLAAIWGALNACGLLLVTLALTVRHGREGAGGPWALGLWVSVFFSGLPSLGLSMSIAAWFKSRRKGLIVGLLTAGVLGFVGVYARTVGVLWLPGALDELLFAGTNAHRLSGVAWACLWFALFFLLSSLLSQLRQRRASEPAAGRA